MTPESETKETESPKDANWVVSERKRIDIAIEMLKHSWERFAHFNLDRFNEIVTLATEELGEEKAAEYFEKAVDTPWMLRKARKAQKSYTERRFGRFR